VRPDFGRVGFMRSHSHASGRHSSSSCRRTKAVPAQMDRSERAMGHETHHDENCVYRPVRQHAGAFAPLRSLVPLQIGSSPKRSKNSPPRRRGRRVSDVGCCISKNKKSVRPPRPRRLCGEFFLFASGLSGLGSLQR
jgi:hypothetical protein